MSKVERTTHPCPVNELHPELYRAVQGYFQAHGLESPETETRLCVETVTLRQLSSRLDSILEGNLDTTSRMVTLLTSGWFVWGRSGDRSGLVVAGVRLKGLRANVLVTRRSAEFRLEIAGFVNDTKEYIRGTLELGSQPAAEKFCVAVRTAVLELNPSPPKERRRWFGM